jgi:hypothetical protein
MSHRATRSLRVRQRGTLVLTAAGLAVLGGGVAVATSASPPVLRSLSVRPDALPATGGQIKLSVKAANASVCVIAASPAIRGLPKALACGTGEASDSVRVGANLTFTTRRFEISARAMNGAAASAVSHRWLTQPALPRTPVVVTCTGAAAVKPAYYLLACADANAYWKDVTWNRWAHTAVGHGTFVINDCKPACFDGHLHAYAMTVRLNRYMIVAPYGPLYCTATIKYTAKGKRETYSVALPT